MTTSDRSDESDSADSASDKGLDSRMLGADTRLISPLWGTRRKGERVPSTSSVARATETNKAQLKSATQDAASGVDSAASGTQPEVDIRDQSQVSAREQSGVGQTVPIPGRVRKLVAEAREQQPGATATTPTTSGPRVEDTPSVQVIPDATDSARLTELHDEAEDLTDPAETGGETNTAATDVLEVSKNHEQAAPEDDGPRTRPEHTHHESADEPTTTDDKVPTPIPHGTAADVRMPLTKRLVDGLRTLIDPGAGAKPDAVQSSVDQSFLAPGDTPRPDRQAEPESPTTDHDSSALSQVWAAVQPHLTSAHELDESPIGSGGQGNIYRVRDTAGDTDFALKVLNHNHSPEQVSVLRVIHGADMPHVADVRAFGNVGERSWELQEWCHGSSMHERFRARQAKPAADDLLLILDGIVDALESLHSQNVVHRDLKPGNILCTEDFGESVRLVDFGVSALVLPDQERYVYEGSTDPYMSPEMFSFITKPAADWWALGIILLECLTGKHPFADPDAPGRFMSGIAITTSLNAHDIDVHEVHDPRWQLLVRGLLTREFTHRWGAEQVRAWRRGEVPEVFLGRDTETISAPLELTFDAHSYSDPREWVAAMASQWDTALTELHYQAASWVVAFRRAKTGQAFVDILDRVASGTTTPARALVELQGRARLPITIASVPVSSPREVDKMLNQIARDATGAKPATVEARAWMRKVADEGLLSAAAHHIPQGDPWRVAASRMSTQCGLIRERLGRLPDEVRAHAAQDVDDIIVERAFLGLVNSAKSNVQRLDATRVVDLLPKDVDVPPAVHSLRAELNNRVSPVAGQAAAAALLIGAQAWAKNARNKSQEARKQAALARHESRAAGRVQRKPLALRRSIAWGFVMFGVAALAVLPSLASGRLDVPAAVMTLVIPALAATAVLYFSALYLPHSGDALVRRSLFLAAVVGLVRCCFDAFNKADISLVWFAADMGAAALLAGGTAAVVGAASTVAWRRRIAKSTPKVYPGGGIGPAAPLYWLWPPAMVWFFYVGSQWFSWDFDRGWDLRRIIQGMASSDQVAQSRLNLPELPSLMVAAAAAVAVVLWLVWDYLPRVSSWLPRIAGLLAMATCVMMLCVYPITTTVGVVVLWMTSWVISSPPKPPLELATAQPQQPDATATTH